MNEKMKNIVKILEIYYATAFVVCTLWTISVALDERISIIEFSKRYSDIIINTILIPFIAIIIFSPAIIILYFLFKKIKNINIRMILTAFMIPFTNLIYYLLSSRLESYHIYVTGDIMLIGFIALCVVLPVSFLATLFVPKNILPIKKHVLGGIVLMFIFGWALVFVSDFLVSID